MWKRIFDFIFPPRCPRCNAFTNWGSDWCDSCLAEELHPRVVEVEEMEYLSSVVVLGDYEGGLRHIIQNIKFNHKKGQASALVPFLEQMVSILDFRTYDYIVPIPISEEHLKDRGYNQVDLIFKEYISKYALGPIYVNVLAKKSTTKPMWGLDKQDRKKNIENAFTLLVTAPNLKGKRILLVDDILTTGSTLSEAIKVLLQAGASSVDALTLASGAKMKGEKEKASKR